MTVQQTWKLAVMLGSCAAVMMSAGCATKGFVREQVSSAESRMQPPTEEARQKAQSAYTLAQDADERTRAAQLEAQRAVELALGNVKREEVRRATVNFGFDSAEIPEESRAELDAIAADLKDNASYVALVTGFTDATGDEQYNLNLAHRRAAAVQIYLARQLGPEFVRLATIGFGESDPVADNHTREGRAQNRRTDVILVRPQPAESSEAPTAAR